MDKKRKKYNFDEALKLFYDKRGAGARKPIKVHVEFEFSGEAGIVEASSLVATVRMFQELTKMHLYQRTGTEDSSVLDIKTKSYVQTELEDNPDWEN